jgi:crotonobetainyl-CoA:carnitine CoA-transferase CaiB-like acyl-CoA transferase
VEELIEDPQVLANGLLVEVEHQAAGRLKTLGPVAQFSETPFPSASSSPTLGQHTAEILKELGYSDEDILRWRQARVVS